MAFVSLIRRTWMFASAIIFVLWLGVAFGMGKAGEEPRLDGEAAEEAATPGRTEHIEETKRHVDSAPSIEKESVREQAESSSSDGATKRLSPSEIKDAPGKETSVDDTAVSRRKSTHNGSRSSHGETAPAKSSATPIAKSVEMVEPTPVESKQIKLTPAKSTPAKPESIKHVRVAKAAPGRETLKDSRSKSAPKAASAHKIYLFNTVEFKGRISRLPKWTRVLDQMKAWKGYFQSRAMAKLPSLSGWKQLKRSMASLDSMGRLVAINKFFNKWPYRLDLANYGQSDYWAVPFEFLKKSGDCEDYAIAKYYALREFGFKTDQMRIVAVRDVIRGIGHAVLVVYLQGQAYVLDNQTDMVLPHTRYKHYVPQYSVNEQFRWMHVPRTQKKQ